MASRHLAQIPVKLLRIHASLHDSRTSFPWVLIEAGHAPATGESTIARMPHIADRVQLVLHAADVLIVRARLPQPAKGLTGPALAYAVEEQTISDPEHNQVTWLGRMEGTDGTSDVLAVANGQALKLLQDDLAGAGIGDCEIACETLMLPLAPGEWSMAWNGSEGVVRTGALEGASTDRGDRHHPPLSVRLQLELARSRNEAPAVIAFYSIAGDTPADIAPDFDAWQRELGVTMRPCGIWDWRTAAIESGIRLGRSRRRWRIAPATFLHLRPAAWMVAIALSIHTLALLADWSRLATQERGLRRQMDARFRESFPDAVAVVNPPLQMRRKLADARHAAGQTDSGDYLPMLGRIAEATGNLAAGAMRAVSYENGSMTLEIAGVDGAGIRGIVARLQQAGMRVDSPAADGGGGKNLVFITVRSS